jgi:hypothetical protein
MQDQHAKQGSAHDQPSLRKLGYQCGNHGIATDYLADCPGQVIERCRFRRGCREVRQIVLPFYTRNERISAPRNVLDEASGDVAFTEQLSERGKVNT